MILYIDDLKLDGNVEEIADFIRKYKSDFIAEVDAYKLFGLEKKQRYFVIFETIAKNEGKFICIVENEGIAQHFCKKYKNYYYLTEDALTNE